MIKINNEFKDFNIDRVVIDDVKIRYINDKIKDNFKGKIVNAYISIPDKVRRELQLSPATEHRFKIIIIRTNKVSQ